MTRPDGFTAYWDRLEADLTRLEPRCVTEPMPRHSTEDFTVHALRMTSVGPYRTFGYLSVPAGRGPFPAVLETPRYGSVNPVPDYNDRMRYVVLTLMHRGQRLADETFAAEYPGLLTLGIDDPETYVYRGIVADSVRGADVLLALPEVDPDRVAVVGDDLALITAAFRPTIGTVRSGWPMFYRLAEARRRTLEYPMQELNDLLRARPDRGAGVEATLALFDPIHHAPSVRATTLIVEGDDPDWMTPLREAVAGPVEGYRLSHEGGTDTDRLDAWLAGRMGVAPMTKFQGKVTA
ncbi:MAG TPA: acetylxylan esterase [Candidatus Dormibacteraeota bacterium]|jgi:cephalosporin-C deacetylase|nr:acetylxylan esterase [Candidatus Dormibacteraeota bacterium]